MTSKKSNLSPKVRAVYLAWAKCDTSVSPIFRRAQCIKFGPKPSGPTSLAQLISPSLWLMRSLPFGRAHYRVNHSVPPSALHSHSIRRVLAISFANAHCIDSGVPHLHCASLSVVTEQAHYVAYVGIKCNITYAHQSSLRCCQKVIFARKLFLLVFYLFKVWLHRLSGMNWPILLLPARRWRQIDDMDLRLKIKVSVTNA